MTMTNVSGLPLQWQRLEVHFLTSSPKFLAQSHLEVSDRTEITDISSVLWAFMTTYCNSICKLAFFLLHPFHQ